MNSKRDRTTKTAKKVGNPIPIAKMPRETNPSFFLPQSIVEMLRRMDKMELVYSFMFFDRSPECFNLGETESSWHISLLDTLKTTCQITRHEFMAQRQHYDCHEIPWHRLDIKFNLPDDWMKQIECLQYRVSSSDGRIHGFLIGNRFYVVWLDPWHNLDRDDRFGPRKICNEPLTEYDKIKNKCLNLEAELGEQKYQNDELFKMLCRYEEKYGGL